MKRFSAHCAAWEFGNAWQVYDGFAPVDGEVYASSSFAQLRADYLNEREAAKALAA